MASINKRIPIPINAVQNPFLLLLLATAFWGGNIVAARFAVGEVSPLLIVFLRWFIVASLCIFLFWKNVKRDWHLLRPQIMMLTLMAAFGFTGFNSLFYLAAHETTALNIGIIQGAIPIFILIGSVFFLRTQSSLLQLVGILITVSGVAIITSEGSLERLLSLNFNKGDIFILLACLFYAGYALALRNTPPVSAISLFTVLASVAMLTSLPLLFMEVSTSGLQWPSPKGWAICLYIAIFPSFLSQIFFMKGVEAIGPSRAGVFINLVPIFGSLLCILLLEEKLYIYHGAALFFVLAGIWISERTTNKIERPA